MNTTEMLNRLHQHQTWVNGNLLNAAVSLTDEQLPSPFQIGQGSIWKSLVIYSLPSLCGWKHFSATMIHSFEAICPARSDVKSVRTFPWEHCQSCSPVPPDQLAVTIVNVEEMSIGWYARLDK